MGEEMPADTLALAESLFNQAAMLIGRALKDAQAADTVDAKTIHLMSRDLKTAYDNVIQERARFDKISKNTSGSSGRAPLDLDGAREEIQRRLACLRAAGSDD